MHEDREDSVSLLLVDDRPENLLLLGRIFRDESLRCLKASSGQEMLDIAAEHDVAVILLDVQMPGMDGFEAATLVRETSRHRHTPIIFITAASMERPDILRGYSSGAVDYLCKPVDFTILKKKVEVFVELFRQSRTILRQAKALEEKTRQLVDVNAYVRESQKRLELLEKAKNALIASERQFRTLVNNIPGVSYRRKFDSDWTIQYISDGITRLCGHSPVKFKRNPRQLYDLIQPDDRERVSDAIRTAVDQKSTYLLEYRILHADGTVRWVREGGQGFYDDEGQLCWLDGAIFDITDAKRAEEDLRRAKQNAEIANRAKSTFLANMSHELRTPLHAILSFAGFGVKKHSTASREKMLRYFQNIRDQGTTLVALVNDLLDLAKLEAGKMAFDFRTADVSLLVTSVVDEFRPHISGRGLKIEWEKPAAGAEAKVDPEKFKQVMRNLLSNAVKFSPENGKIDVAVEEQRDALVFSVRDEGPGIPEDELEEVFGQFVQSSATKTNAGGTGLGLAICREILAAHQGRIWAENNSGGGAQFIVEVPVSEAEGSESVVEAGRVAAD